MIDTKRVSPNVGGIDSGIREGSLKKDNSSVTGGTSFQQTLEQIQPQGLRSPGAAPTNGLKPSVGLNAALGAQTGAGVKFSNHAVDRMVARGIRYSPEELGRINQAVEKAQAKGSKDTLVLLDDSALIVSVKNKTVVTVMDRAALKENVFTNIDSTIVM